MKRVILLFFTIFFGFMCKAENFTYTINGENTIITKYNGSEKSVVFPAEITDNTGPHDVTSIEGSKLSPVISNTNVEEIYIPKKIKTIKNVTTDLESLKSVVIEDGTNLTISNAFYIGSYNDYKQSLDNIIVLSTCTATSRQLISSNHPGALLRVGEITLNYQINNDSETIQMYLYSKNGDRTDRPFGSSRFRYLLSALQKRGTDISTITRIDLSKVPNNTEGVKVPFTFDDENYDPSSELSTGAEVIISSTESYTATGTRITTVTDKENYTAPQYSILTNISYSRTNTHDWNSVCLPFDIKETDFATDCKIYTISAATDDQISLTRVETPETIVEAGTPCFIYSTANEWNLNLTNVTISYNVAPKTIKVDENWEVIGSFTNETIGTGKYKLNSQGSEFGITNNDQATVTAFRCYISPTSTITDAPAQLKVRLDEEASITLVPNDAEPQKVKLYDLMGRPRKEGSQGIFIKSTR